MTSQHPVHPSRNLIQQWLSDYLGCTVSGELSDSELYLATQAARWGADQELEACCAWVGDGCAVLARDLRDARRPKPPSLKEQALQALYRFDDTEGHDGLTQEQIAEDFAVIRRALEALPDE